MGSDIITISVENVSVEAELSGTATAEKIGELLPFDGSVNTWGEEIYFAIPVTIGQEPDAQLDVDVGSLAYWPTGKAFCIFFGPTPVSKGEKPRAYSPVNVFGQILGDATVLKGISDGSRIRVSRKQG